MQLSRRELLAVAAAAPAAEPPSVPDAVIRRNDREIERLLAQQVTEPNSRWVGGIPDGTGLHQPHTPGALINYGTAAFLHPRSRYHRDVNLRERMQLGLRFIERSMTSDGNISLLTTNFNSPPDTAFLVWNVAEAASIARRYGAPDIERMLMPVLQRAGRAMARGGVHTPNHRWVICSALAQIHALWPDSAYTRRIDQWLAEGVDIDEDGQYTERSTAVYNPICDRALIVMAVKLGRPELFEPVLRNLESMLWLLHPGYEIVTEISTRQDLNQVRDMGPYWFPLACMAARNGDGRYATLARHYEDRYASLPALMEYPELFTVARVRSAAIPDNYERVLRAIDLVRIRRGPTSASILTRGQSRFFHLRRGGAVIEAVRFASAFFGKGQFVPSEWQKQGTSYVLRQRLEGPYYQPLDPPAPVRAGEWPATRSRRRQTEVCRLQQIATLTETDRGFRLRLQSWGTEPVPIAIEVSLRAGAQLEGAEPLGESTWLLRSGMATLRAGDDAIRFGPGTTAHKYIDIRGAEPKLAGPAVYLTGYTPFDHTLEFTMASTSA